LTFDAFGDCFELVLSVKVNEAFTPSISAHRETVQQDFFVAFVVFHKLDEISSGFLHCSRSSDGVDAIFEDKDVEALFRVD
jgi:hypothetical protein